MARSRSSRSWWRRAIATVAIALAVGASALGLAACQPRLSPSSLDAVVYRTPLPSFERWWLGQQAELRRVTPSTVERWLDTSPRWFDDARSRSGRWDLSTDLCSASPDRGPAFDFRWPCIRHDLAWRNLHRLDALHGGGFSTRTNRVRASEQFLADLLRTCEPRPYLQRTACRTLAHAYHRAVLLAA